MVPGGHGRHRDAQTAWSVPHGVRHQHGCCNCEPRRLCDGSKRGINRLPPETTVCPIPRRVVRADDERFPRSEHIPPDAFGDAPLRGFGQRFASDENRPRRGSPVHAFRSRPIRLEFSGEDGWRVFGAVRRFRPDHRAAVTPRHHEKPFPRRRRAIVASPEFPPVNAVAEPPQPPAPRPERRPGLRLDRLAVGIKRPPRLELFHVLQRDQPRAHLFRPPHDDPRQIPYVLRTRFPALGFREMRAVRRSVQHVDRLAARRVQGVDRQHVGAQVQRAGMVRGVHGQRLRVVVDRNVRRMPQCPCHACTGPAAAREEIDDQAVELMHRIAHFQMSCWTKQVQKDFLY